MADTISSAGLLFLHLQGRRAGAAVDVEAMDTYRCIGEGFYRPAGPHGAAGAYEAEIHVFAVLGAEDRAGQIDERVCSGVKENCKRLLAGRKIRISHPELDLVGNTFFRCVQEFFCRPGAHIPRSCIMDCGAFTLRGIWCSPLEEEAALLLLRRVVAIWAENEAPCRYGRQLMLRSFLMRDLVGRKVIAYLPRAEGCGALLFEGGQQLSLDAALPYGKGALTVQDLHAFSVSGIQGILLNPVYAYGKWLYPDSLREEWHKVFLYLCAISPTDWTAGTLAPVYGEFLEFLQREICDTAEAPAILSEEQYLLALLSHIRLFRSFLRGEDEPVISKDLHLTLNSRYVYLPYLWRLFPQEERQNPFSAQVLRKLIRQARSSVTHYEKGTSWEAVATYVLEHISGWSITGRRVRAGAQEIDISVVNVSLQDDLWQMGAYVLVECKNWRQRVDLSQIRNLAHISGRKGNQTVLLFAANGHTREAEKEIRRLVHENLHILSISAADLETAERADDLRGMLLSKWRELEQEKDAFVNL